MTTITQARRAAKIAAKTLKRPVTLKKCGAKNFIVCIGYTDKTDERVVRAWDKKGIKWGWNAGLDLAADASGFEIETVERVSCL